MRTLLIISLLALAVPCSATETRWSAAVKGGVHVFFGGQSSALNHRLQPVVRADVRYRLLPRLDVGVEASFALGGKNYRLMGGYFIAALGMVRGDLFELDLVTGAGVGHHPAILYDDLSASHAVGPWFQWGLAFRWAVVTDLMDIGVELLHEHLSVLTIDLSLRFRF